MNIDQWVGSSAFHTQEYILGQLRRQVEFQAQVDLVFDSRQQVLTHLPFRLQESSSQIWQPAKYRARLDISSA